MAETLEAMKARHHQRDLVVWRLYGAVEAYADGADAMRPDYTINCLCESVAKARAELAELEKATA